MKPFKSLWVIAVVGFATAALFAQAPDSSQVKNQERLRIKSQEKVQTGTPVQTQQRTQEKMKNQTGAQNQAQNQVGAANQNQVQHGLRFVDENGDGFNDNAPDADGDGIPNGQDPDYQGAKARKGNPQKGFVDEDGDGINDNMMNQVRDKMQKQGRSQQRKGTRAGKVTDPGQGNQNTSQNGSRNGQMQRKGQ